MNGSFFYDRFSRLFEKHFLNTLQSEITKNPMSRVTVLVPSNLLGQHLKHQLSFYSEGHINVRFLTFVDLATTLLKKKWIEGGKVYFPPFGEELLIEKLSEKLSSDSYFASVSKQKGFLKALKNSFHDLLTGGVTEIPESKGRKLTELRKLFFEHRNSYLPKYATVNDGLLELLQTPKEDIQKLGTTLFCYGFVDFSGVQKKALEHLTNFISIQAWTFTQKPTDSTPAIVFFRRLQLSEKKLNLEPLKPKTTLSSMSNEETEVEQVVRKFLQVATRESLPLHRIAILVKSKEAYFPLLRNILSRAGIPFYIDGGAPFSESGFGRSLSLFLQHIGKSWKRTDIIDFLSMFPFEKKWVEGIGSFSDWDLWTRKSHLAVISSVGLEKLNQMAGGEEQKRFAQFVRNLLVDQSFFEKEKASWKELIQAVIQFIEKYAQASDIRDLYIKTIRELLPLDKIEPVQLISKMALTIDEHLQDLSATFGIKFEQEGVYVGTVDKIRSIPFQKIALLGLQEGIFPAYPRTDPLLLDSERLEINRMTGGEVALKSTRMEEDRSLFEQLIDQAEEEIWISAPRSSIRNQKPVEPSLFFTELAKQLPVEIVPGQRWLLSPEVSFLDERDWSTRFISNSLIHNREGTLTALQTKTPLATSTQNWIEKRLTFETFTEYDGLLPPQKIPANLSKSFSPSDVARYATCPYQFFLSKLLNLAEVEEPENIERIEAKDKGELIHEVLFTFFTDQKKEGRLPVTIQHLAESKASLLKIADETFAKIENQKNVGNLLLWKTEKDLIKADLVGFLEWEAQTTSGLVPHVFEEPFTFSEGQFQFRGRIDRIDLSPDQKVARVIDYKSGSLSSFKDGALHQGESVQLPIYLLALPHIPQMKNVELYDGVLLSTSYQVGFKTVWFTKQDLEKRRSDLDQMLQIISGEISKGHFIQNPGHEMENCKSCDFQKICGKTVGRTFERKCEDPLIRDYLSLKEIQ